MIKRAIYLDLWKELSSEKQMIFLSGPRQVGKTTLAKDIATNYTNNIYFNWDIIADKKTIIQNPTFFEQMNRKDESMPLIIFDEIHKYKQWKNYLKGIYDQFAQNYLFLISGSGRLDLYQKGGDSLAGRYLSMHLFPFTLYEFSKKHKKFEEFMNAPLNDFNENEDEYKRLWETLWNVGGFPEPFIKGKKTFWNKWANNYSKQILYEDIRTISDIKNIDAVQILYSLLPSKIASPISINSLAGDIHVAFDSVKNWLNLFDIYYLTFRISPWAKNIARAIVKEKKLYLFNYPEIHEEGPRFENMIALELYKAIYNWNELGLGRFSLHYIKNKSQEEVDFLITDDNVPKLLIEAKFSETSPQKSLYKFQNILNIPAIQLVHTENIFKYYNNGKNKILVISAYKWLTTLP